MDLPRSSFCCSRSDRQRDPVDHENLPELRVSACHCRTATPRVGRELKESAAHHAQERFESEAEAPLCRDHRQQP